MDAESNNEVNQSITSTNTEFKKTKKKKGVLSRLWGAIFRLHGDDFEKRLQYISKEEAAILSRIKQRSNSCRRMTRHLILFSVLIEVNIGNVTILFMVLICWDLSRNAECHYVSNLAMLTCC